MRRYILPLVLLPTLAPTCGGDRQTNPCDPDGPTTMNPNTVVAGASTTLALGGSFSEGLGVSGTEECAQVAWEVRVLQWGPFEEGAAVTASTATYPTYDGVFGEPAQMEVIDEQTNRYYGSGVDITYTCSGDHSNGSQLMVETRMVAPEDDAASEWATAVATCTDAGGGGGGTATGSGSTLTDGENDCFVDSFYGTTQDCTNTADIVRIDYSYVSPMFVRVEVADPAPLYTGFVNIWLTDDSGNTIEGRYMGFNDQCDLFQQSGFTEYDYSCAIDGNVFEFTVDSDLSTLDPSADYFLEVMTSGDLTDWWEGTLPR